MTQEYETATNQPIDLVIRNTVYMGTCQRCGRCYEPSNPLDKLMVTGMRPGPEVLDKALSPLAAGLPTKDSSAAKAAEHGELAGVAKHGSSSPQAEADPDRHPGKGKG